MSKQEIDSYVATTKQDNMGPAHIHVVWVGQGGRGDVDGTPGSGAEVSRLHCSATNMVGRVDDKARGSGSGSQALPSDDDVQGRHEERVVYKVDDEQLEKAMAVSLVLQGAQNKVGRAPTGELERQLSSWLEAEEVAA